MRGAAALPVVERVVGDHHGCSIADQWIAIRVVKQRF